MKFFDRFENSPKGHVHVLSDVPLTFSGNQRGDLTVPAKRRLRGKRLNEVIAKVNPNCLLDDEHRELILAAAMFQCLQIAIETQRGLPPAWPAIANHVGEGGDPVPYFTKLFHDCAVKALESLRNRQHHDRAMVVERGRTCLIGSFNAAPLEPGQPAPRVLDPTYLKKLAVRRMPLPSSGVVAYSRQCARPSPTIRARDGFGIAPASPRRRHGSLRPRGSDPDRLGPWPAAAAQVDQAELPRQVRRHRPTCAQSCSGSAQTGVYHR
jgi:hypothetical protein